MSISVGSEPALSGSVIENADLRSPASSGYSHCSFWSSVPASASTSELPESGAPLPNTTGAYGLRAEDLVHEAELDLAEALAAEIGREVRRPQLLLAHLLLQRGDRAAEALLAHLAVDRLDRPDLLPHERLHPVQLLLELGLGREVPRHAMPRLSRELRRGLMMALVWPCMSGILIAAAVGVAAGAAIQAATGFGFAVLAAPLTFAALDQREAIGLLLLLGMEIGVLTLATEGRRPRPRVHACVVVLAWSVPAAVVGVYVLRALDAVTLQIAVTIGVAATLILRRFASSEHRPAPGWAGPATGLSAGALVTSTNTSGPPLLLYLTGRGEQPVVLRDTLTVCQLGLSVIGALAIVITGTPGAVPDAGTAGRVRAARAASRTSPGGRCSRASRERGHYEPVLNARSSLAVLAGLTAAVL